jgi:hypothetical protein
MRKQKRITHKEVREAMTRFVRNGGIINKLPEQKSARTEFIGQEKYENFESLASLLSA